METSVATMESDPPRMAWELPDEHLFRLIYRVYDIHTANNNNNNNNDAFHDLRRPVDWVAVESRLVSHPQEAREWIRTDCCLTTSFLHQFSSFNFGVVTNVHNNHLPILSIDEETALRIMNQVITIYPEALNMFNGNGCLPVHLVCERYFLLGENSKCNLSWTLATESIVQLLYRKCPASFSKLSLTSSKSALSLLLDSCCEYEPGGKEARSRLFDFLVDIFPEACQFPDSDYRYPLHVAAHSYCSMEVMQKLLDLYPQAAEVKCTLRWLGTTPLQAVLRCGFGNYSFQIPSMLLDACPWSAVSDDEDVLMMGQGLDPSGDALDYLCVKYCELVRLHFSYDDLIDIDDSAWQVEYRKGYIKANVNFIISPLNNQQHDLAVFGIF